MKISDIDKVLSLIEERDLLLSMIEPAERLTKQESIIIGAPGFVPFITIKDQRLRGRIQNLVLEDLNKQLAKIEDEITSL